MHCTEHTDNSNPNQQGVGFNHHSNIDQVMYSPNTKKCIIIINIILVGCQLRSLLALVMPTN